MAEAFPLPRNVHIQIRKGWCKGCGICVALCPKEVLALDDTGKVAVANPDQCIGCGRCEIHCPDFAIGVEVGEPGLPAAGISPEVFSRSSEVREP